MILKGTRELEPVTQRDPTVLGASLGGCVESAGYIPKFKVTSGQLGHTELGDLQGDSDEILWVCLEFIKDGEGDLNLEVRSPLRGGILPDTLWI